MTCVHELLAYFSDGIEKPSSRRIGMEVETSFLTRGGKPISTATSQKILSAILRSQQGEISIVTHKGEMITVLQGEDGEKFLYELGRQNIELSSAPNEDTEKLLSNVRERLKLLYRCARKYQAYPAFTPVIETEEDLLVVPDERDAAWIKVDGREALKPLATITAVQFTVDVAPEEAIPALNHLGVSLQRFLETYPQDSVWRAYVRDSQAHYREDRYGGPLFFESIEDYCRKLTQHSVVQGERLVPFVKCKHVDIPLYLRSIWWYFRLKRYGSRLCIEVRPLPRKEDGCFEDQLKFVMETMNL